MAIAPDEKHPSNYVSYGSKKWCENKFPGERFIPYKKHDKEFMDVQQSVKSFTEFGVVDVYNVVCGDESHNLAVVHGGKNGSGNWLDYLREMRSLFADFKHAWLVDIQVDCLDDVFTFIFGFEK